MVKGQNMKPLDPRETSCIWAQDSGWSKITKAEASSLVMAVSSSGTNRIDNFFKSVKDSLESNIAELWFAIRISFCATGTSNQMREAFWVRGYKPPERVQDVRNLAMNFFDQLKSETKWEIRKLKVAGTTYSVTTDEYTRKINKRYANLSLHHHDGEEVEEDSQTLWRSRTGDKRSWCGCCGWAWGWI